jgi:hypothetical protein
MGCFNTQGFLSKLDIEWKDKIFMLICAPNCSEPINWKELDLEKNGKYAEHEYSGECNNPISFPIFGEYDDYGSIENIQHDFNTDKLESIFDDKIETVIDVLYNATVFPHCMPKTDIDKYKHYKEKLGINLSDEHIQEQYDRIVERRKQRFGHTDKFISFDKFKELEIKSTNRELTWTIDHRFVYDTISSLYPIDKPRLGCELNDFFRKIWGTEIESQHTTEKRKYQNFESFLRIQRLYIDASFCTSQEYDWDRMLTYINSIKEFIEINKLRNE